MRVEELLNHDFAGLGSEDDAVVLFSNKHVASEHIYHDVISGVVSAMRHVNGVKGVLGPYDRNAVGQISSDEHAAVIAVTLSGNTGQRLASTNHMQRIADKRARGGVHVWVTGYSPTARDIDSVASSDVERAESIGLPVAFVILLVTLGTLPAALLPLGVAGAGLLLTYGLLSILAPLFHPDSLLIALVTMIGLGIGLDYSLFIIGRFREEFASQERQAGASVDAVAVAMAKSMATSGRTVAVSGMIVASSLASLCIIRSPLFFEIAVGATVAVVCTLAAALTLLPALLLLLGQRIGGVSLRRWRWETRGRKDVSRATVWGKWALAIMRTPRSATVGAISVLVVSALPVLGIHYGINIGVLAASHTDAGEGERILARSFAAGAMAPMQIVMIDHRGEPHSDSRVVSGAQMLRRAIESNSGIAGVAESRARSGVVLTAVSSAPIDSMAASNIVHYVRGVLAPRLHADGGPTVLVGGATAQEMDFSNVMRSEFPVVLTLILSISLILLMISFRSLVLPVKAIMINLLVTSAAIGIVVFVFQDRHGERLLGFSSPGFIQAYLPTMVFALLFGLSMDYEVFLVHRIYEEWRRSKDIRSAIATGVARSARSISAAAAIMIVVFGSFVAANLLELKEIGFALAVAIALDATLARFVLVPAVMCLLGARSWWLPTYLAPVGTKPNREQPPLEVNDDR